MGTTMTRVLDKCRSGVRDNPNVVCIEGCPEKDTCPDYKPRRTDRKEGA